MSGKTPYESKLTYQLLVLLAYKGLGPSNVLRIWLQATRRGVSPYEVAEREGSFQAEGDDFGIATERADRAIEFSTQHSVQILSIRDWNYPARLRQIPDPPPILFVRGSLEALHMDCLAIVGTRKPSRYGVEAAKRIARSVAESGICVVSGLAIGIDTAAHVGALAGNGVTVAILAQGFDKIHPLRNAELADRIVNTGGALVTEHLPTGQPTYRHDFVRRNRIQSGLSAGSLVVESGQTGGSIRQARFTFEQHRGLFVVMPQYTAENSDFILAGSLLLMDEYGAKPVYSRSDVTELVGFVQKHSRRLLNEAAEYTQPELEGFFEPPARSADG